MYRQLFIHYLRPYWRQLAGLQLLLLFNIALRLSRPQLLRYFIDGALTGNVPAGTLTLVALIFLLVALGVQGSAIGLTYLGEQVGWAATNQLRADLTRHCLSLDMAFHKKQTPGALIERVDGDVTALANFFSQFLIRVIGNLLIIVGILLFLLAEDWRVGVAVGSIALLNLLILSRLRGFAVPRWVQARQSSATLFGFLEERLIGSEDIQANGGKAHTLHRLQLLSEAVLTNYRRGNVANNVVFAVTSALFFLGDAVGVGMGVYLAMQGIITVGTVYLIYNYGSELFPPLEEIQEQLQDFQKAAASLERVIELLQEKSDIADSGRNNLPPGPLAVHFHHLSFAYDHQSKPTLDDISLSLPPGRILGLLGRTGSGKTTLTRLLFRLYDPAGGHIEIGNHPLTTIPLPHLRQRIGLVTQDVQLFKASVRHNLTFFQPNISDEQIRATLQTLGLGNWLASLPDGLDTVLGAGNSGLSAGQAQLLAFGRVFLKNPGLVILDEPSSRLDPASEQLLEQAIERLLANRTAIIIAHRLSTVQRADDILILDSGRIIEYGPRLSLANNPNSHFARLLRTGAGEVLS